MPEDILLTTDEQGGTAILTVNSPQSHYGVPVLRIEADDVDGDFGPADLIGDEAKGFVHAADVVAGWVAREGRTDIELDAARRFCRQWPEGPQIP